jgi:hypothetical protein
MNHATSEPIVPRLHPQVLRRAVAAAFVAVSACACGERTGPAAPAQSPATQAPATPPAATAPPPATDPAS